MGKLVLEPDERELHREAVSFNRKRHIVPGATLVLTDRRIVRVTPVGDPRAAAMLGPLAFLFGGRRTYAEQIYREDYAGLEVVWAKPNESYFVLRSTGQSYLHVAIEVITRTPADEWRDRLHRWSNGEWPAAAAALPSAKLVKR